MAPSGSNCRPRPLSPKERFQALSSAYSTQDPPPRADASGRGDALRSATTVLLAEDDADIRLMVRTTLGVKGYRVIEARDGQEALDVARLTRPDLILMDLQLPRLNGFAVTRFLRQDAALRSVPIIVISAHDPAKHRNLALAAGCNAYVQKPLDLDALDAMMLNLLGK